MIISVCGVERAGKTTLTRSLCEIFEQKGFKAKYLKTLKTLDVLSEDILPRRLTDCSHDEAVSYYKAFTDLLVKYEKEYDFIICDMHIGYINKQATEFFSLYYPELYSAFDIIYYLNTLPEEILRRIQLTHNEKACYDYSQEQIVIWQNEERNQLASSTMIIKKDFSLITRIEDILNDSRIIDYMSNRKRKSI